jgi:hypothetical protein
VEQLRQKPLAKGMVRVWVPGDTTHLILNGRMNAVLIPQDRIVEMTMEESIPILQHGGKRWIERGVTCRSFVCSKTLSQFT